MKRRNIKCYVDIMYPNTYDKAFEKSIIAKAEFRELLNYGYLQPHQELIRRYISPYTPYDRILLYHTMGTGKTFICISTAEDHYREARKICVVLTKGNTSTDSYKNQIYLWLKNKNPDIKNREVRKYISERYIFYHHITFCKSILSRKYIPKELTDNILFVIDEVHNIVSKSKSHNKNPLLLLVRYVQSLTNSKVILLSGTPMTNDITRIPLILTMLISNKHEITDETLINNKQLYSLIKGRISYYATDDFGIKINYVGDKILNFDIPIFISYMTDIQKRCYEKIYHSDNNAPIYMDHINASLFVFSDGTYGRFINDKIIITKDKLSYFVGAYNKDYKKSYTCNRYKVIDEFSSDITYDNLSKHSSKYYALLKEINNRPKQKCFVYIREIIGSGLILFSCILEKAGYELYYGQVLETINTKPRYTICVGSNNISPNIKDRVAGFNDPLNKDGQYVLIMLGSNVMSESISLFNVRHFHCLSPHWNLSTVNQAIRRVIRKGSHDILNEEDRSVDIYIHASILDNINDTIDIRKIVITSRKESEINPVKANIKDSSIEKILSADYSRRYLDCSTYVNYIRDDIMDIYIEEITKHIYDGITLRDLSIITRLPFNIIRHVLSYVITYNIYVRDYYGRISYLREVYGIITYTRNPLSQLINMDNAYNNISYKSIISIDNYYNPDDFIRSYEDDHPVQIITRFNNLTWKHKIQVIERMIELASVMCNVFENSIIIYDAIYHIYNYRKPLRGRYRSSARGIKALGLTRKYINNTWTNATYQEEERVLIIYHGIIAEMEIKRSISGILYMYSTVDMILRVSMSGSDYMLDMRAIRRGRNIDTLSRKYLKICCRSLGLKVDSNDKTSDIRYLLIEEIERRNIIIYI